MNVEDHAGVFREPDRRVRFDDHRDGAVRPIFAGGAIFGIAVDGVFVRGGPLC